MCSGWRRTFWLMLIRIFLVSNSNSYSWVTSFVCLRYLHRCEMGAGNHDIPWIYRTIVGAPHSWVPSRAQERKADGKPANPGWPNYVKGILTPEDTELLTLSQGHRTELAQGLKLKQL